ncbi:MAG: Tn3 family transposase [Acidimicrobiales bacterium]
MVHRPGIPAAHRAATQPGRVPQRPPPVPVLRSRRRDPHAGHEDQTTQALCHTLVVNACVLWTTTYLAHALADTDQPVPDEVIAHLSPARHQHINPYGTYTFNDEAHRRPAHRPLRPR